MLGEVSAALSLWDRFKKWREGRKNPPGESIATRFVCLFGSHGVHRNQIPRFIGHGLTLSDLQTDTALLAKLDELLLDAVCTKFAVRREWLDGAESQIHQCHDFYKHPEQFVEFLDKLLAGNSEGQLTGVLLAPKEPSGEAQALIILQEAVGAVGEKTIYRYHLLNNWTFAYWKARAYLTACIAIAWKRRAYIRGVYLPGEEIQLLAEGNVLLGWKGEGIWELGHTAWHPEDMALYPERFLKGIDPERGNFGFRAALKLWLDLEKRGLMDAGINANEARELFEQELANQRSI